MRQLQITPLDGYDPEIGRWLWALQDVRHRYTLRLLQDLDPRLVDWEGPDGQENAIGSLLYHIAKVELGWLYGDLKGLTDLTPAVKPDFPFPSTESDRTHLTRVLGIPLAEHVARLEHSRDVFLQEFQGISSDEWRRLRRPPDFAKVRYEVTPEWAVFHHVEHETGHAFQISSLKAPRLLACWQRRTHRLNHPLPSIPALGMATLPALPSSFPDIVASSIGMSTQLANLQRSKSPWPCGSIHRGACAGH
jgi:hypothetical protein